MLEIVSDEGALQVLTPPSFRASAQKEGVKPCLPKIFRLTPRIFGASLLSQISLILF